MSEGKIFFRKVEKDDYAGTMELIKEFHAESLSGYGVTLDFKKLQAIFDLVFESSFVAVDGAKIVGVFAGRLVEDICSADSAYEEQVWFVTKNYRRCGLQLRQYVEEVCIENGVRRMIMSVMHNLKTDKLLNFYDKIGFVEMETRLQKILK